MTFISAFTASRPHQGAGAGLAVCLLSAMSVSADEAPLAVQGVFCNSERQLAQVLDQIERGVDPRYATESANTGSIECTFADRLHYQITDPVPLTQTGRDPFLTRFKARLVGVMVGDQLRPVSPPAEVYFVSPQLAARPIIGFPA